MTDPSIILFDEGGDDDDYDGEHEALPDVFGEDEALPNVFDLPGKWRPSQADGDVHYCKLLLDGHK